MLGFVRQLLRKTKNFYQNFNLFPSIPSSTNPFDLRIQRISTRLFILCLLLSTTTIIVYISLVKITNTVNVNKPTVKEYLRLHSTHSETLICPCTTISIDYKAFLHTEHTLHQVCTSIYVTKDWINYLALSFDDEPYDPPDFRWTGTNIFQTLSTFCALANRTIFDVPLSYDDCDCGYSDKCRMQLGIYSYPNLTTLFSIAGFYTGCFVMESLLQSTLECFYNQTCVNELRSYLVSNTSLTVTALDSSLPSRFFENSTIQKLVDELMVEQWNLSITFENYYSACQPIKCTYSYTGKHDIIYIMTTVFGLIGGMVTILKLVIPLLVKLVFRNKRLRIATTDDFRWTGPNTFRALSGFCELINKTISENLIRFYSTQYVSATITSTQLFQSTAQYFFEQFISSTTQDLLLSLQVIRDTVQADSLWSVAGIQYRLQKYNNSRNLSLNVRSLSGCSCDDSAKCIRQSSIYRYSDQTRLFSVQGQYVGCFVTEALLQSSLQCFYNQTCINELRTYLTYNSSLIVTALNASLLNRFFENSTIQELVDKLMIEQWNLSTTFYFRDFRSSCKFFFQALRTFCELTNKTISDSLNRFYSTQYISAAVISSDLLDLQMQSIFEQYISLITNQLLLSLQMIQNTTQINALFSARWTNYDLRMSSSPRLPGMQLVAPVPQVYSNCRCDVSLSCIEQSAIYDGVDNTTKLFSIPGIYSGCFVMESLLHSTVECFYNETCIEGLSSYFLPNTSLTVTALDSSLPSRFFENSTIQELVDELMVEQWNLSITFENYYSACQPIKCTYSYTGKHDIIYIMTTVFGLIGGMVTILKLVVPRFVKILAYLFLKR
ncbi:unnamed protein product [Rotaria sp. Silwood1]|nr:unnamed protein product [Rotaria sp. Silwood1]